MLGGRAKILTCQKAGSQADAHVSWKRIQRIKDDVGAAGPGVAGTRVEEWMVGLGLRVYIEQKVSRRLPCPAPCPSQGQGGTLAGLGLSLSHRLSLAPQLSGVLIG